MNWQKWVLGCGLGILLTQPSQALTSQVSVAAGTSGNGWSLAPDLTFDGHFIAYESYATNLVVGQSLLNTYKQIFRYDANSPTTLLLTYAPDGVTQGNGNSANATINDTGSEVAFESLANNLVTGDLNGRSDIFLRNVAFSQTLRVSISSTGVEANNDSYTPRLSRDGRYVAFASYASNLVANDTNNASDIFVYDLSTKTTKLISLGLGGVPANGDSYAPSISQDGSYIAFESRASNLVSNDTNKNSDIFFYDTKSGLITRVSVGPSGIQANGASYGAALSADGNTVAYFSKATNLGGDTDTNYDVYLYNRTTQATTLVSKSSAGIKGNGLSWYPSISGDGSLVAYYSLANNLVSGDTNNSFDVYLYNQLDGSTVLRSVDGNGAIGNSDSQDPVISKDGTKLTYWSYANNLVANDTNNTGDVFTFTSASSCAPQLTSINPISGPVNTQIRLFGQGYNCGAANVLFIAPNGQQLTGNSPSKVSDKSLLVRVPANAVLGTVYQIQVVIDGSKSPLNSSTPVFTVTP